MTATQGGAPRRLYPIIDILGGGSIEAVADASGALVERILYADSYGDAPRYLHGPVVDRIDLEIETTPSGEVAEARVRVHATDPLQTSVLQGVQFRAISGDGSSSLAVGSTSIDSEDPHTAILTISAPEWTAALASADRIEIAVLDSLTSPAWAHAPPQPAPAWMRELRNVGSEPDRPIVITESRQTMAELVARTTSAGTSSRTIYEVADLYGAAADRTRSQLLTTFKAAPFIEPATGLLYLRARWYDAQSGSFATPDPSHYRDSSNLYAFAGGDPANNSDPSGEYVEIPLEAVSLGVGLWSFNHNMREGNWGMAAWDLFGIGVDTAGLFVPGTLAVGVSTRAVRAGHTLTKGQKAYLGAQAFQQTGDAVLGLAQGGREYRQGNYGWGTFYLGMSALGVHGAKQNVMEIHPVAGYGATRMGVVPGLHQRPLSAEGTISLPLGDSEIRRITIELEYATRAGVKRADALLRELASRPDPAWWAEYAVTNPTANLAKLIRGVAVHDQTSKVAKRLQANGRLPVDLKVNRGIARGISLRPDFRYGDVIWDIKTQIGWYSILKYQTYAQYLVPLVYR